MFKVKQKQNWYVYFAKCQAYKKSNLYFFNYFKHDDNKNVKVVIATMTNNAKGHQEVSKTEALLRKVVASLKRQVLARDIVFLESPASLNFDIFPYNQMANSLCKSAGITLWRDPI